MKRNAEFYELVEKTAYDLYCRRGKEHNQDIEDWLTAETIVSKQYDDKRRKKDPRKIDGQ